MDANFLRMDPNLLEHPKIIRLIARYGEPGFVALYRVWSHAAKFNPLGRFDGVTSKELGMIARSPGKPEKFIQFLIETRLLDLDGETVIVHGWTERQPFIATAEERATRNRQAAIARWGRSDSGGLRTPDNAAISACDRDADARASAMHDASAPHTKRNARTNERSNDRTIGITRHPKSKKQGTELPHDLALTEADRSFFANHFPDGRIETEFEKFRAHHQSKGTISKDWSASWRTWAINAQGFFKERNVTAKPQAPRAIPPTMAELVASRGRAS